MEFKHTSVLLTETIDYLNIVPDGVYVDGTLGGGGHGAAICEKLSHQGVFIGIDRDEDALKAGKAKLKEYHCQKHFVQGNFEDVYRLVKGLGFESIDGAVLDLGVSSFQLDNPQRGFSYMQDAPLDMRMNQSDILTAYDVINEYDEKQLGHLIKRYGEERWAHRISEFIHMERRKGPITNTFQLVDIIKRAIPASARREGPHPAKRTFQAIRIEVNDELGQLERAIDSFIDLLATKGRLCIITFHSLEDRIVKEGFNRRANPCTCPKEFPVCVCGKLPDIERITSKPLTPGKEEVEGNPRARSAKLRVVEKR
ncbi:MAG: 16S rRNA (cytosine(1402)-N(4))-methyltransferase RsmH [Anaerovoracaceae bacterium]|jgi:16S rRNA (cytosine1402-N4)-methyltransferase